MSQKIAAKMKTFFFIEEAIEISKVQKEMTINGQQDSSVV